MAEKKTMEKYIKEYGKAVYSFCLYATHKKEDADDLYQQTFLTAFEKGDIDEEKNPKSYLITIAANIKNNYVRKYLWRKRIVDTDVAFDEGILTIASDELPVDEKVVRDDETAQIRRLVRKLPDKYRDVVLMFYMEDMNETEISKVLSIPKGTVKSRLNKARKLLKEMYLNG